MTTHTIGNKMDHHVSKSNDISDYVGNDLLSYLFYIYLLNKYKSDCIISTDNGIGLNLTIDEDVNNNTEINDVVEQIVSCSKNNKIIIVPLSIKNSKNAHANVLIVRPLHRTIEHFEPHGQQIFGSSGRKMNSLVQKSLKRFNSSLNELSGKKYKLLTGRDICPNAFGLQSIEGSSLKFRYGREGGGYCLAWSMFFTEMVLQHPDKTSSQVYDDIMKKTDEHIFKGTYLLNMIRGYIHHLSNKLDKYFSHLFGRKITVVELIRSLESDDYADVLLETDIIYLLNLENKRLREPNFDIEEEKRQVRDSFEQYKLNGETKNNKSYATRINILNQLDTLHNIRRSSSSQITQKSLSASNSSSSKNTKTRKSSKTK